MRYVALAIQRLNPLQIAAIDFGGLARWTLQRIFMALGACLFLIGLVFLPLPIPLGLPLMLVGAVMVVNTSYTAKRAFLRWLRRHPGVTRRLRSIIGRRSRRS